MSLPRSEKGRGMESGMHMKTGLAFAAAGLLALSAFCGSSATAPDGVFAPGDTVLFIGDSITHGGRMGDMNHYLGHGYQAEIASRYLGYRPELNLCFFNRGVSGDDTGRLLARWDRDVLHLEAKENGWTAAFPGRVGEQRPKVVSLMTGVNDFRRRVAEAGPGGTTLEWYAANLEKLVSRTLEALPGVRIVLCEPFNLIEGDAEEFSRWRKAARDVAERHGLCFVDFQRLFDEVLLKEKPERGYWFWDRYHPTYAAHLRMADWWIEKVREHGIRAGR